MLEGTTRAIAWTCLLLTLRPGPSHGQEVDLEDQTINTIRSLATIGPNDQRRIGEWVQAQVHKFNGFRAFRKKFQDQYNHANNSQLFPLHLAARTAAVAVRQAAKPGLNAEVARALAQVLLDMNHPETFSGLIALLTFPDAATRYLCATGLFAPRQKRSIVADKSKLDQALTALRAAGLAETDPIALGRIYEALSYPAQAVDLLDIYLSLFDKRLALRRGPASIADGAERYAFAFFREQGVVGVLNAGQKSQLVERLAVFLRLDAERYNTPQLGFREIDRIERTLWIVEETLSDPALVGDKGGKIRKALSAGGYDNRSAVLQQAYRWVGDPHTNERGALNDAPWNVSLGAP